MLKLTSITLVLFVLLTTTRTTIVNANEITWTKTAASFGEGAKLELNSKGHIFAKTRYNGLYRSSDFGATWDSLGFSDERCIDFAIDMADNVFLITKSNRGDTCRIRYSDDYGNNWSISDESESYSINTILAKDSYLYAIALIDTTYAKNGIPVETTHYYAVRSEDSGKNWTRLFSPDNLKLNHLFSDYKGRLYTTDNDEKIFISNEDDNIWELFGTRCCLSDIQSFVTNNKDEVFYSYYIDEHGPIHAFYKTLDRGDSWQEIFPLKPTYSEPVYLYADFSDRLFAFGTSVNRIVISYDDGKTWISENAGIEDADKAVTSICSDKNGNTFISTEMGTVYYAKLPAETTPVELAGFAVISERNGALLSWVTNSESNNFGFSIERKLNENWEEIGFVKGVGTTSIRNEYTYFDENQSRCEYRLRQIDFDGQSTYSDVIHYTPQIPQNYFLSNYPNPFNNSTTIHFAAKEDGHVRLNVYNVSGQQIIGLADKYLEAGNHFIKWNGKTNAGQSAPSGIYIISVESENYRYAIKTLLRK